MKIVIDMNLSPEWVEFLKRNGYEVTHWKNVGNPNAQDIEIITWAREKNYVIFTNDLDFGRILALTNSNGPSLFKYAEIYYCQKIQGKFF